MNAKDRRKARRSESRRWDAAAERIRTQIARTQTVNNEQQTFLYRMLLERLNPKNTMTKGLSLYGHSLIFQILKWRPQRVAHFVRYHRMDVPLTRPIGMTALQILQDNSGVNDEVRGNFLGLAADVAEEGDSKDR